ncbi:MAG: hypothetical protein ACF8K1_03455 [Phycisphaerales bacterium JB047]
MLIVSICIATLALVLLLIGFRGRVSQRGVFCRKCRFDLAGIDIDTPLTKCPECGSDISSPQSRRDSLRRRSPLMLAIASVLILVSVALLGFGVSGQSGIVLGWLPDGAVLWLTEQGMGEALDELVVRVSDAADPLPDELWKRVIEDALTHQADQSQVWDPRWGEVLSVSFGNPLMTDAQMEQYIRNGFEVEAVIRDRVHRAEEWVDVTLTTKATRVSSLNFNNTAYYLQIKPITAGVEGEEPFAFQKHDGLATNFYIGSFGSSSMPWHGQIQPTGAGFNVEPGTEVPVFIEYELKLIESGRKSYLAGHFRSEQSVLVLPEHEPIVPLFTDPTLAQQMRDTAKVTPLRVLTNIPGPNKNDYGSYDGYSVIGMRMEFDALPAPIALVISIRFADGTLVELGEWVQHDLTRNKGIVVWPKGYYDPEAHERATALIDRLLDEGVVDVVFHTDPSRADHTPGIDRVLELVFEIEDVPVEGVENQIEVQKTSKPGDPWYGVTGISE